MSDTFKKQKFSKEDVKHAFKQIDRKINAFSSLDYELSGKRNKSLEFGDDTPLIFPDNKNLLGAISVNHLTALTSNWEQEQLDKSLRYEKLRSAQEHPEIDGALNIYADEVFTEDAMGDKLHVRHPDPEVRDIVDDLYDRLDLDETGWHIVRNFCGYGDEYKEVILNVNATKILKLNTLPRKAVERVEETGILQGFRINKDILEEDALYEYSFQFQSEQEKKDELMYPFRVLHFRLNADKYGVYGQSIIDSIVSVIEQLKMMEKSLLIARVTRAPERRVYNIDVGNLMGEKAIRYSREVVSNFKNKKLMSYNSNSQVDLQKDIWGTVEDLVMPKRAGSEGNSINTLEQLNNPGDIGDIEYLRDKIFPPLGIPRQYLFDDTFAAANTNLSSKSIPFAKRIRRVQRVYLKQMYKLAAIELKLKGYSDAVIKQLSLKMNNPSNLDERDRIAVDLEKWNLIASIKGLNSESVFYPDYLIYRDILQLEDDQIVLVLKLAELQAAGINAFEAFDINDRPTGAEDLGAFNAAGGEGEEIEGGMMGGGGGGGAMPAPGEGGELPPMEGEEEGGGEIPDEVEAELGPSPENASFKIDTENKIPLMEEVAMKKKKELISKLTRQVSESMPTELDKEEHKYEKVMKRTQRTAFGELFVDGQLSGLETIETKKAYTD